MLRCVSITPLGSPVEPEVKITRQQIVGLDLFKPSQRSSKPIGVA